MTANMILPLGADGVLVRFGDVLSDPANRAALAFCAAVEAAELPGVVETASSLVSVFVRFRPDQVSRAVVVDALGALLDQQDWLAADLPAGRRLWHIPTVFDGAAAPDLDEVAGLLDLSAQAVVTELTAQPLRVLALGFAPGQPYLGLLPDRWNIPRRTEVTPQVPRGAVVVAVRQVIPFANAAPTGWRQIGRTAFRCYDAAATPPLPLGAGDEVQFQPVPLSEWERLTQDARGGAEIEVLP